MTTPDWPLSQRLLEGSAAETAYMNDPLFHRTIDAMVLAELRGEDSVPVLQACLLAILQARRKLLDAVTRCLAEHDSRMAGH